jgi:acetoin:2,6-dichlorophenolindophenol oxidoreductase subunit alpha
VPLVSKEKLHWAYERMTLIRAFEEKLHQLIPQHRLPGFAHLSAGQEAVAVGVCAHLDDKDFVTSTHRGHGHCIAKGLEVGAMMAELYGKSTGCSKGKGGSFHIADLDRGMLGTNGIVGAGLPLACGPALVAKVKGTRQVAASFFGEGATNQGAFHEATNLASVWKLPVLFVCENNLYSEATPVEYAIKITNIADRADAYGIPGVIVDGMDFFDVYEKALQAVERARNGEGPTLLEAKTYRYFGHYEGDAMKYRAREEEQKYSARDPTTNFKRRVLAEGLLGALEFEAIEKKAVATIEAAVKAAEQAPWPRPEECLADVYVTYP